MTTPMKSTLVKSTLMSGTPPRSDFATLAWPEERDACGVGFVAATQGQKSHKILEHALTALDNLSHRGAVSADGLTGDGAGVLTQLPHKLFRRELAAQGVTLEHDSDLAVGVFFVSNASDFETLYRVAAEEIDASHLTLFAWREIPIDVSALGEDAKVRLPVMRQVLLGRPEGLDDDAFERLLYLTRKRLERRLHELQLGTFYIPSFSHRTVSYKGLMVAPQLPSFYKDLADPDFETAIAVFHQRYSTNTMPRWSLAQPFRFLAHNGEINTLQGNVNFMRAREAVLESSLWGDEITELLPIIAPGGSDSAALDNAFELLVLSGRDPMQAMMMLVPEAYEELSEMEPNLRAFYEYHGTLMEPWDGPAALALTDGRFAVAAVDRNGLRPQRYWLSSDGVVVVGSEAGMVPLPEDKIVEKGKLEPGSLLVVDTVLGKLLRNDEVKARVAAEHPYREWLERSMICAPEPLPAQYHREADLTTRPWDEAALLRAQKLFGYSSEDYDRILAPMALSGEIPVGSMGDDTPLAVLSEQPQSLFRYFKQRFAQVTNPPIDPLRERLVMSLETMIGPRGPLLEEDAGSAKVVTLTSPVVGEAQFAWLKAQEQLGPRVLQARFPVAGGPEGLESALALLCDEAVSAVEGGAGLLIISDREVGPAWAPIPSLLATGAVHHRLIETGLRTRAAIAAESGEPREDHHIACLIGYGAAVVHPYLALASARDAAAGAKEPVEPETATTNYLRALEKGLLKIMSKMGISAVSSYRAAQIFEALGVSQSVIDRFFRGTPSRIGGAGLEAFATDVLEFHADAFGEDAALRDRGLYRFRKAGEYHALNPLVFKALHKAVRTASFEAYGDYAKLVDERPACNLRDLLTYKKSDTPLSLDEIEPVDSIVTRFTTQAMSHGSVSRETHETLAVAMNRLGAKSNSGEGGEDARRFRRYERDMPELSHAPWHPKTGDWGNSAIKQVASGRFGVTPEYLVSAQELEIKMAQGSKPGEGGQIPGHKVNEEIAAIRRSVPGVTLISPPPHHDIYSIEDLAQLIYDLKRVNKEARVGVKLVASAGVGTIAAGVAKGYADNIQISGFDGGTGASPLSSVKNSGVPWELGLAETQQVLLENNLRGRVSLRVDGGMKTGRDVMMGALLGAEEYGFGTSALVAAGCVMQRACHLNTCSVGIATQREDLRKKFPGQPEHVVNFLVYVAQQVRMILAEMGFRTLDEVVGRVDLLSAKTPPHAKAALDLSAVLRDADPDGSKPRRSQMRHNDRPEDAPPLDETVYQDALETIATGAPLVKRYAITNRERSVGARLAGEIARVHGDAGLPSATVQLHFSGVAGQSFGVFNISGVQLTLEGEAQDYVGKGMAGGEIIVRPPETVPFTPSENTIIGNTVLYGATGGSLYAAGRAGERLAVRNSGARVVVEGCGDHGCEYMTGGVTVVLGSTGRNFGAGMSGGVAYVFDETGTLEGRTNGGMVALERLTAQVDTDLLKALVARHAALTGSAKATALLANWEGALRHFWKAAPKREGDAPGVEGVLESTLQEVQSQPVAL